MMMTIFMSWKYKFLLKRYRNWQKFFRDETEKAIPELKKLDKQSQELVDAILSFAFIISSALCCTSSNFSCISFC